MVSHLASFWEWDFLELGNGLLLKTEKNGINFFYLSHNAQLFTTASQILHTSCLS